MVPAFADVWLLVAYSALAALVVVQYRRGKLPRERVVLLLGMCFTWSSYALLQVTDDGPVPTGTPANYALDALSLVLLVVGLYALYWWWRHRGDDADPTVPAE